MSHSGIPGANLLSNNAKYNPAGSFGATWLSPTTFAEGTANLLGAGPRGGPLGGVKNITGPLTAAGLNFIPGVGPALSAADFAAQAGGQFANGNTLGGILDLGGAGYGAYGAFGGGGGAGAAPAAGTGTAASTPSTWDNLMASLGVGGNTAAAPADAGASGNVGDFTALSPSSAAELSASDPAGQAAIDAATGGPAAPAASPGILGKISAFTGAHPFLTTAGGLVGSQLLSPALSGIGGGGLTSQEKAMLSAQQPGINAANQLVGSEASGVLPPGAQASVSDALQSDIANIKSRYAAMGDSGSSAEQQDIANAEQQAAANQFNIASGATATGLKALNLNQSTYNTLVQDQLARQRQLQQAFAGYFNALGMGTALSGQAA